MERREDVGSKVIVGTLSSILLLLVTLFINSAWSLANEGKNKAFEVSERVTAIESKFLAIQLDLNEIKGLLRRGIPNGARN